MKRILLVLFFVTIVSDVFSQHADTLHYVILKEKLEQAMLLDSSFTERIDVTVSNMPVAELLKNIAKASDINLNLSIPERSTITCNFNQIRISDFIFFICREYQLDAELVGNILLLNPLVSPSKSSLNATYDSITSKLSFDFNDVRLIDVTKKLLDVCGINVLIPQTLFEQRISAYGKGMDIDEAIRAIASVNSLINKKKNVNTWLLYSSEREMDNGQKISHFDFNDLNIDSLGFITANIGNGNIKDILIDVSEKLHINHFFSDNLDHPTAISVDNVDFNTFLKILFTGTDFSWRVDNGVYIFGKTGDGKKLSVVKVIPMKYRTIDKVEEIIPANMKEGLEIVTFPDLNSLILHGEQGAVIQVSRFLIDIDKSVPLISIDVIIVDATDTDVLESGVSMGMGKTPATTAGSLSPGVNFSLSGASVNKLINSFNGFGSINLGKVSPNFYMDLKFLEEKGKIILRSTPRLSTLNGHKASLISGERKYYKESQVSIIGTQNPLQSESYQWKEIEANFTLDVLPYVSLDSCITLQIDIVQNEFTERESEDEDAPPGMITRSFKSIIKVNNQEMVLLGGIEKNMLSSSSKGLPFIARIPVFKWLFGSTTRNNTSQKLNIFIKPTIL